MKTILLSVVLAHICTGTINDEAGLAPQTSDASLAMNDWNSSLDQTELNYSLYFIDFISFRLTHGPVVTRFMPLFYILIFLTSLPLNALASVIFTCKIREKKPAEIYMTHLACVDLLFTLLLPLKIHYHLNSSDWVFGDVMCHVVTAAFYWYTYCSVLLMMCMSVDRLLGVVFPIASLTWRSTRKASCACVLVWLLALTVNVLLLSFNLTNTLSNVTCLDQQFLLYLLVFSIFICIIFSLPLVVTLVSYIIIIYVLCVKSNNVASSSNKQRKAIIMAIAVLAEFVICFGLTNVILAYFCVCAATGKTDQANSLYYAYMLAVCLGSASVFLDPLLYYYGSSQFRQMIRSVLNR